VSARWGTTPPWAVECLAEQLGRSDTEPRPGEVADEIEADEFEEIAVRVDGDRVRRRSVSDIGR